MPKVTIKDIAQKAGVSITSVSFAFNNPNRLGEETVQRILEVADELGYIPNPIARSMTSGRTGTLGVLVPQPLPEMLRNPFLFDFLEGVGEICTRDGFSLMLIPPLQGSMKRAIEYAAVDGFLTLGLEEHKSIMVFLRQRNVPFTTVDSDPLEGVPAVNVDDEPGASSVMEYILENGHRHIAIVSIRSGKEGRYDEYVGTLRNRINGYKKAFAKYGLEIEGSGVTLLESSSTTKSGGKKIFDELLKLKPLPTAVVAMSDIIAIGILEAAREAGISIPDEISVVGFDNIPIASLVCPSLTTVSQPIRQKGRTAADLLTQVIQGDSVSSHIMLPTELVIRESVKMILD